MTLLKIHSTGDLSIMQGTGSISIIQESWMQKADDENLQENTEQTFPTKNTDDENN